MFVVGVFWEWTEGEMENGKRKAKPRKKEKTQVRRSKKWSQIYMN